MDDGRSQQLEQACGKRLATGRVANNQRRVVQTSQFLGTVVVTVGASRHQRHQQTTTHEEGSRVLVTLQALADVDEDGVVCHHLLYLLSPPFQHEVEPGLAGSILLRGHSSSCCADDFLIRLSRGFLNRILHRLGRHVVGLFFLLPSHTLGGTGDGLRHILITLVDNLLHPRLRLHDFLDELPVAVEHEQQVCGQFKTFCVTVGVCCTGQLVAIACINNRLNIIVPPLYTLTIGYALHLRSSHRADIASPLFISRAGHNSRRRTINTSSAVISRKLMIERLRFLLTVHGSVFPVELFVIIVEKSFLVNVKNVHLLGCE